VAGQAFNVGGGPHQVLSLLDLVELIERRLQRRIPLRWEDWRPGDQRVYVSDIRKLATTLKWKPEISVADGVERLLDWIESNRAAFLPIDGVAHGMPEKDQDLVLAHDRIGVVSRRVLARPLRFGLCGGLQPSATGRTPPISISWSTA
jgi:hypothetical protein